MDFEIDEENIELDEPDIVNDQLSEAVRRIAVERERLLALALQSGYDGVDIHMDNQMVYNYDDYKLSFEYEAWEGEPPTLGRFERNVQRYDFRTLSDREKIMLLSRLELLI